MGETVVSGGDPAEVLEAAEHALDGVSVAIEHGREAIFPDAVALGWNVRRGSQALDLSANGIAVVALVAIQDIGCGHPVEQRVGGDTVRHLATGQEERDRAAEPIGERVDFRGAPAARATDRLIELPPFPPEALR